MGKEEEEENTVEEMVLLHLFVHGNDHKTHKHSNWFHNRDEWNVIINHWYINT